MSCQGKTLWIEQWYAQVKTALERSRTWDSSLSIFHFIIAPKGAWGIISQTQMITEWFRMMAQVSLKRSEWATDEDIISFLWVEGTNKIWTLKTLLCIRYLWSARAFQRSHGTFQHPRGTHNIAELFWWLHLFISAWIMAFKVDENLLPRDLLGVSDLDLRVSSCYRCFGMSTITRFSI